MFTARAGGKSERLLGLPVVRHDFLCARCEERYRKEISPNDRLLLNPRRPPGNAGRQIRVLLPGSTQPKEQTLKSGTIAGRVGIVALLALGSIAFHELGHFIVYRLGGCPVRITLQSVRPIGHVSAPLDHLALAAGPAFSLIATVACLLLAWRHRSFFWVTAAFTNATLRLFPLAMDMFRAIEKAEPFSDEGNLALAITTNPAGRMTFLLLAFIVFASLTVVAARRYNFEKHRAAKVVGIYLLSLAVGIAVVLIDELLR